MSLYVRGRAIGSVDARNAVQTASARWAKSPCESLPLPQPAVARVPAAASSRKQGAVRRPGTLPDLQMGATER
jgi:hypothetical protein